MHRVSSDVWQRALLRSFSGASLSPSARISSLWLQTPDRLRPSGPGAEWNARQRSYGPARYGKPLGRNRRSIVAAGLVSVRNHAALYRPVSQTPVDVSLDPDLEIRKRAEQFGFEHQLQVV